MSRVQKRLKQGKNDSYFDKHEQDRNNNFEEENNKFFYQRPLLENEVGYEKKTQVLFCRRRYDAKSEKVVQQESRNRLKKYFYSEGQNIETSN